MQQPSQTQVAERPRPATAPRGKPELFDIDLDERPFTIAWELTRACALACVHCRAEAQPKRDPDELTTAEALDLVDQIADLAPPVLVLTGGDPMMRPDLFEIVEHAIARGQRVAVSPTTTALPTRERLRILRDLGVAMIHVSVDGADAATHDQFRGVPGTFARAGGILSTLQDLGMPTQVGTTITRHNIDQMPEMAQLMADHGIRVWNVFYLVPTGRGREDAMISVDEAEASWDWLAELSERAPFAVRTTAAPQFRRTMLRRAQEQRGGPVRLTGAGYQLREAPSGIQTRGVNDGKGFMFVDHVGNLCPSGFLQLPAGNVRTPESPTSTAIPTCSADSETHRSSRDDVARVRLPISVVARGRGRWVSRATTWQKTRSARWALRRRALGPLRFEFEGNRKCLVPPPSTPRSIARPPG